MNAIAQAKQELSIFAQFGIIDALIHTFNDPLVKSELEDKNQEQLQRGERADNSVLPNYSPVSVAKYGKPAGRIKLYDTGAFYQSIKVDVTLDGIEINASDHKTPMLTERYGDLILGIQPEEFDSLKEEIIIPHLQDKIRQYFNV